MHKKIDEVSNAVVIIDGEGIIFKINPVATRMFGYSEAHRRNVHEAPSLHDGNRRTGCNV